MQFRRIHGRIVPIRDANERSKERKQGAAAIVAGAAAAGGAGVGTSAIVKKAMKFSHEAKDDYRVAQQNLRAALKFPVRGVVKNVYGHNDVKAAIAKRLVSKKLFRARNPLLHAGAAASALLIGHGVTKISESYHKKGQESKVPAGKIAGAAAAVGTYGAYYRGLGFKKPLEIGINIYSRAKGMARPFKKYGKGGPV